MFLLLSAERQMWLSGYQDCKQVMNYLVDLFLGCSQISYCNLGENLEWPENKDFVHCQCQVEERQKVYLKLYRNCLLPFRIKLDAIYY